jgi:uncharacterized protein involved in oxidation of intracellular sulfur
MVENPPEIAKHFLFIVNDSPYGIERPYNALRLAMNISKRGGGNVSVFLVGDGVFCAKKGQKTPDGFYNIERMIQSLVRKCRVAT